MRQRKNSPAHGRGLAHGSQLSECVKPLNSNGLIQGGRLAEKQVSQLRQCFFQTVFSLLGHVAKCDGQINAQEVRRTRVFMEKMELTPECKVEAQELFNVGASQQFDLQETLQKFQNTASKSPEIVEILLVYLISLASTDGPLSKAEMDVVKQVATALGFTSIIFDHMLKMVAAQDSFNQWDTRAEQASQKSNSNQSHRKAESHSSDQKNERRNSATEASDQYLAAAFKVLDISTDASEAEIKKAYRKLVNQFHPDKLIDKGLPPQLLTAATDRFRGIRTAYEYIRKYHLKSAAV
jgi:DnaJ like chaperone protein